jgi:carboxymethylenebutenolidase
MATPSSGKRLLAMLTLVVGVAAFHAASAQQRPFNKQRVTYANGALTLVGFIYKPDGPGPFPTVVWNHGSEPNPGGGPQFDSVAAIFVPAGYVVVAPTRRGHGDSQGTYIEDVIRATYQRSGDAATTRLMVELMAGEQLSDQLAGLSYAKSLAFVDTSKLVVAGCSYGGIETLLAAERGAGFKAAMPISPAALSWRGNAVLQNRLIDAVRRIDTPVLLIQPPNDASLEPAKVLGAEAKRAGKSSFTAKIYPATMPDDQQGHCFGGVKGMHNWANEALEFFGGVLGARRDR